jgi:hypothetical protein
MSVQGNATRPRDDGWGVSSRLNHHIPELSSQLLSLSSRVPARITMSLVAMTLAVSSAFAPTLPFSRTPTVAPIARSSIIRCEEGNPINLPSSVTSVLRDAGLQE